MVIPEGKFMSLISESSLSADVGNESEHIT